MAPKQDEYTTPDRKIKANVEEVEFMDDSKLEELARQYETDYLATLGTVHWLAYPFMKTARRACEVFGCKKPHD